MSATPSFDIYQQVFTHSMLANRASAFTGASAALQTQLQYELAAYLSGVPLSKVSDGGFVPDTDPLPTPSAEVVGMMGDWELVWGPVVWSESDQGKESGVADNAMYVARQSKTVFPGGPSDAIPTYVVAIAATNPLSNYDWTVEDFRVSTSVAWDGWDGQSLDAVSKPVVPGTPVISMGTAIGVSTLLSLRPPACAVQPGRSLQDFLSEVGSSDSQSAVVFTGHSLAGALSPTLARFLQRAEALSGFTYPLVFPTAGATPGNGAFVKEWDDHFPSPPVFPGVPGGSWTPQTAQPYQTWNTLLWNCYDVVPHAWYPALGFSPRLLEIPTLYGSPVVPEVQGMVDVAVTNSSASTAVYEHTRNASLAGTKQTQVDGIPLSLPPTTLFDFLGQLAVQHMGMYFGLPNNVPGLILPGMPPKADLPALPGVQTKSEDLESLLKAIAQWIRDHLPKESVG